MPCTRCEEHLWIGWQQDQTAAGCVAKCVELNHGGPIHMQPAACQFVTLPLWHGVVKPILGYRCLRQPLPSVRIAGAGIGHLTDTAVFGFRAGRIRSLLGRALRFVLPDLLIADEPTTALEATTLPTTMSLLRKLQMDFGMGMMLIHPCSGRSGHVPGSGRRVRGRDRVFHAPSLHQGPAVFHSQPRLRSGHPPGFHSGYGSGSLPARRQSLTSALLLRSGSLRRGNPVSVRNRRRA